MITDSTKHHLFWKW